MSFIHLDAEALYAELLRGVKGLIAMSAGPLKLVGVTSGGAWLAARLQRELGLEGEIGVISSAMHRDDYKQRGLSASSEQTRLPVRRPTPGCSIDQSESFQHDQS